MRLGQSLLQLVKMLKGKQGQEKFLFCSRGIPIFLYDLNLLAAPTFLKHFYHNMGWEALTSGELSPKYFSAPFLRSNTYILTYKLGFPEIQIIVN